MIHYKKNQTPKRAVVEELNKKDVTYVKQIAKWRNIFFLTSNYFKYK